ncbi:hypothetical protein MBLNU230_g7079t1 [Neophaeotheca triangularis]
MAAPTSTIIHRIPRTDLPNTHILLHITPAGTHPLDLKLIATQHENLFHATTKETSIKSLQATNYTGNLSEWKTLLQAALLHHKPSDSTSTQGLETVATISGTNPPQSLTLTFRKNVGGITQRLGSLVLTQDDAREEVGIFEWVDEAVATSDSLRDELESLQNSAREQQSQVQQLTRQLDELVVAKKEHEDLLMGKFMQLLNAKKLKVRDQQRLLESARVDGGVARAVGVASGGGGKAEGIGEARTGNATKANGKTALASRKGKRKATAIVDQDGDDEEPALEIDVKDEDEDAKDSEDEGMAFHQETPDETDDATEVEDEGDASNGEGADAFAPASGTQGSKRRERGISPSLDGAGDAEPGHSLATGVVEKGDAGLGLPARPSNTLAKSSMNEDDDETDDEL